jgi:hypothetical protein
MKRGRIEAGGNTEMASVAEDQLESGLPLGDVMLDSGHKRSGTDMDRQEGRRLDSGREVV